MLFDIQRILALAVLLLRLLDRPLPGGRPACFAGSTAFPHSGLDGARPAGWYHTSAGTQLIPYDWFIALEDRPLRNSFTRTGILVDPTHPDRLPIGFSKTEGPNVSEPQVGLTCAFCHTTQFTYQGNPIRIEGGPSLQYNQRFLQIFLESLGELKSPEKFIPFATRVLQRRGQEVTQKNLGELANKLAEVVKDLITRGGKDASPALWGPGRFDALGRGGNAVFGPLNPDNLRPANAPASIPALWGVWEYDWVQWAGSIQHRSPEILLRSLV